MNSISVITIAKNEAANITGCLESVCWADELIVVDSGSVDETVSLARKFTDKVFVTEWKGYSGTKEFALRHATNEWILWLDADEQVTPELAEEIRAIVTNAHAPHAAYEVARRAYFLGRWIRHCGWYPGYVVRLFRKSQVRFSTAKVHERIEYRGSVGRLRHDLLHFTDPNLYHYFDKLNTYTSLAAEDLTDRGRQASLYDMTVRPVFLFAKMYVLRLGFLDGMHGLILSLASASYVFTKYAKVWERQMKPRGGEGST